MDVVGVGSGRTLRRARFFLLTLNHKSSALLSIVTRTIPIVRHAVNTNGIVCAQFFDIPLVSFLFTGDLYRWYISDMGGEELRRRREDLGLTQAKLAEVLMVAANTVARWERGERSIPAHLPLALVTVERDYAKKKGGKK